MRGFEFLKRLGTTASFLSLFPFAHQLSAIRSFRFVAFVSTPSTIPAWSSYRHNAIVPKILSPSSSFWQHSNHLLHMRFSNHAHAHFYLFHCVRDLSYYLFDIPLMEYNSSCYATDCEISLRWAIFYGNTY